MRRRRGGISRSMTTAITYNRWQPPQNLTIPNGTSGTIYAAVSFNLSDILASDLTNYKNLFDMYRFNGIVVRFRLQSNPDQDTLTNSAIVSQTNFYPEIYCCVDHNDSSTPTSIDQLCQYGPKLKTSIMTPQRWVYYRFHPSAQFLIYSGLASGYGVSPTARNPFINCDNDATPHYGLKYAVTMPIVTNYNTSLYVEIQYKYNITFKSNK